MKHRIMLSIGVVLAGICSLSAAAQTACSVGYTITNQWPGGFGASLTIKNTGTTAISSWTLTWSFANGQAITQLWNGSETQSGANVTVSNLSYDGSIPAGGSVTGVGFNGSWNNATNSVPASFALNGVTCGGGSGGTTGSFSLSPSTTSLSVTEGKSATDTISIADAGSFSGNVALSVSGLPSGVTASFATNPATSSSILTLTANSATVGTSTVTVTGTSGTATATTTIALTVTAGTSGSFTLSPAETSLTVSPNAGATDTITVDDAGGFTGSVTLTASGMPSGVTASFSPNPTTGSSVLTLTAGSSAATGTSMITVQGTSTGGASGNLSATTTVSLTVSATPALQIAWVSPASGVAGSSVTILPAGVGGSFGSSQGSSEILFGSTQAAVTTWTVNSIAVVVPNLPAGVVTVTAVVDGVTSNAVPFTVTSTAPSPEMYTGNSTWFSGLGGPYGGCGVPQTNLDSQNFVALNVQNDPGNYSLELSRPISSQFASDIGLFDNGLNCGRWVHVTIGANCQGTNDGAQSEPFCRGGVGWVDDQFTGAQLDLVVVDSCQDGNAWCRDDPYHLDQAQGALNNYVLNGQPVGDMYPSLWNNRQISWYFEPSPNYTGDINIGFLNGANAYWSAISITHLPNGIHGVNYLLNGVWTAATMDADLGDDYIVLPTVAAGTQYEIQVVDVTGALINNGRIYSFSYPSSCGTSCTPALTPITYTTSSSAASN